MNDNNTLYEFSYEVDATRHELWEQPEVSSELSVPLEIFRHASCLQALSRFLVDQQALSFTAVAQLLGRSPKTIWASHRQTAPLPTIDDQSLKIPIGIFTGRLAPLEALVSHLRKHGFRNIDVAQALQLSPKTTSTVFKRAEVKQ